MTSMVPPPELSFFSKADMEVSLLKNVLFKTLACELSFTAIPIFPPMITFLNKLTFDCCPTDTPLSAELYIKF